MPFYDNDDRAQVGFAIFAVLSIGAGAFVYTLYAAYHYDLWWQTAGCYVAILVSLAVSQCWLSWSESNCAFSAGVSLIAMLIGYLLPTIIGGAMCITWSKTEEYELTGLALMYLAAISTALLIDKDQLEQNPAQQPENISTPPQD